jgi:hypothetical protein
LVAYRDRTVFIPAAAIAALDHLVRGAWWPQSVYGDGVFFALRPAEHAAWLLFETLGLSYIVHENLRQCLNNALLQHQIQKETEGRAERRAAALARLILESPDEVLVASAQSLQVIEVNNGACSNLGYRRDELLSTSVLDYFTSESVDVLLRLFAARETERLACRFEVVAVRRDDTEYPCRLSLHRGRLEGQDVWLAFLCDLTEHKRLENKLRQSQKLESLGQLATGIAHEINTPMQCVVGNIEFMERSFSKLTIMSDRLVGMLDQPTIDWDQERAQFQSMRRAFRYDFLREQTPVALQEAVDCSNRIVGIVRAMKTMSHPGTSAAVDTDLHELIRNAATISRNRWCDVANLKFEFDPRLSKIQAHPAELAQVFLNLLVNASDAIAEKPTTADKGLAELHISTVLDGEWVAVRVRDSGTGMPESVRQKIFDPFFTTKQVGKGTGQGLSIAYDIVVNRHRGSIDVESEPGAGTLFTIRIPIAPPPLGPAAVQSVQARPTMDACLVFNSLVESH